MGNSGQDGTWRIDRWKPGLPLLGFKVWYGDGTTFDSSQGPWAGAARVGVQCVKFLHEGGRSTFTDGYDEYTCPGETVPLLGLEIDWDKYIGIIEEARRDAWRLAA